MKARREGIRLDVLPLGSMPSSGRILRVGYGRAGEVRGSSRPGPMNGAKSVWAAALTITEKVTALIITELTRTRRST